MALMRLTSILNSGKHILFLFLCFKTFNVFSTPNHSIEFSTDYFSKDLDFVNYLEKIETSSTPESLQRYHIDYDYIHANWMINISLGNESGRIKRNVQPFSVSNKFSFYDVEVGRLNDNRKQVLLLGLGQMKQNKITLECVERRGVLLGGNCAGADFRLLDGDNFDQTGESNYLPVLSSDAQQYHFSLGHAFITTFHSVLIKFNTSIKYHYIKHHSDSPLFALESDFLLDSEYNGQTLRSIIAELRNELPQENSWHDVVLEGSMEFKKRIENMELNAQIGLLYSEKINYESEQKYKNNMFLKAGFTYRLTPKFMLGFSGTAYQHYLQGIQPILYTPKTARFFAHPYGEVSAHLSYQF